MAGENAKLMAKPLPLKFKRHSVQIAELDHKLHWVYWTADQIILTVRHVMNSPLVWSPTYEVDSAARPIKHRSFAANDRSKLSGLHRRDAGLTFHWTESIKPQMELH